MLPLPERYALLFLFTGSHSDYHKATDDWDKINYDAEKDIVKSVYRIIEATDTKGKLGFTNNRTTNGPQQQFYSKSWCDTRLRLSGTGMRIDGVAQAK